MAVNIHSECRWWSKVDDRARDSSLQPTVPIISLKGPPANDVIGPLGVRSVVGNFTHLIAFDQNCDQCCTHTPDRAAGNTIAIISRSRLIRVSILVCPYRYGWYIPQWTRSSRAGTRADAPCDEHPLRSLQ